MLEREEWITNLVTLYANISRYCLRRMSIFRFWSVLFFVDLIAEEADHNEIKCAPLPMCSFVALLVMAPNKYLGSNIVEAWNFLRRLFYNCLNCSTSVSHCFAWFTHFIIHHPIKVEHPHSPRRREPHFKTLTPKEYVTSGIASRKETGKRHSLTISHNWLAWAVHT